MVGFKEMMRGKRGREERSPRRIRCRLPVSGVGSSLWASVRLYIQGEREEEEVA